MVEELGLDGRKEKVITNVANSQKVNLMSATMEIGLESLDGQVHRKKSEIPTWKIIGI